MLIEKSVSIGDIVSIKLISGEEIMAKLEHEDSIYYTLSKPMVIAMTAQGPSLLPYMFTINHEQSIKLLKSSTATLIQLTDKNHANQYIELTTNIKIV